MDRFTKVFGLAFALVLAGCGDQATASSDDDAVASSDLTTAVRASDVSDLVEGPTGELLVSRSGSPAVIDDVAGTLTEIADSGVGRLFRAADGVTFRIIAKRDVIRHNADGSETPIYTSKGFDVRFTGFDATHFYFHDVAPSGHGTSFYRAGFGADARMESLGAASSSNTSARVTAIADGKIYFTIPEVPTKADVWMGVTPGNAPRVIPFERGVGYVHPKALAFHAGDLYVLGKSGDANAIFKVAAGDLANPFERVCSLPASYQVVTDNGLTEVAEERSLFVVDDKGFYFPIDETVVIPRAPFDGYGHRSAVLRVGRDCAVENLTGFGPVVEFGWPSVQIPRIAVRGDKVFFTYRVHGTQSLTPFELRQAAP